jgi:hypothetical protein
MLSYVSTGFSTLPGKVYQHKEFDMAQNFDPNQQQQYNNPQYTPLPNQQFSGAPQQGYAQATQQTYPGQPVAQHGMQQYANQTSMQPYYQQSLPSSQWQTATNSATTTTTTTTTTKSSKQSQASKPKYGTSYATSDFASLMQQPPQQQTPQQTIDYTQFTQNVSQQRQPLHQPQPQQAINYSQLMQNVPQQTQTTVDFTQLMQATPVPQPQVPLAPPIVPPPPSNNQASSSMTKTTKDKKKKTTTTTVVGGASRQQAANKSEAELHRFDRNVSEQLKNLRMYGGICPMGYDYYATRQGYLCGGGSHFFAHEEVEAMLKHGTMPRCEQVNGSPWHREITPPPGNGDGSGEEPTFWSAQRQLARGMYPFARLKDPKNRRLNGMGPGGGRAGGGPFGDW